MAQAVEKVERVAPQTRHSQPIRWTSAQYHAMGRAGVFEKQRVELIDGEIWPMSPIGDQHWISVNKVSRTLSKVFPEDSFVVSVQSSIRLRDGDEPEPDIAVIEGDLSSISGLPSTAALIVEVAYSTLRTDRTVKANLYARAQIADYWVVDLKRKKLIVFREPTEDAKTRFGWHYQSEQTFSKDQSIAPLARPDAPVNVADLLP